MRNGHMFITIEHIKNIGISKLENMYRLVCSGTKPFYYFWVKGFDTRRRDIIFDVVVFIWPPSRAAPIGCKFTSRLRAPKVDPPRLASSTQLSNFLQILANHRALLVRDVTRTLSPPFVSDYCDISEWHLHPPARTPASMLHLTNPCAEPKGSQPN